MSKKLVFIFLVSFFTGLVNNLEGQIITTVGGNGGFGSGGDGGPATAATFDSVVYVAVDAAGNILIGDQYNNAIRKINTAAIINTIAGVGTPGYSGDGFAATLANINMPWGVAADAAGNIYISDQGNNCIRKVSAAGIITTIAGTGVAGFSGDGLAATAAKINIPYGIAVDATGNVFFADNGNSCIRKVSASGTITTVAGLGGASGYSGDGGLAILEKLNRPTDVAVDASGNLYIADMGNNRIRKVTGGTITTIAGTGAAGFIGDGGSAATAKVNAPMGVKVDGSGNIYIADANNNRIRKISTSGIISTVAGNGIAGYSGGDGGLATAAEVNHPTSVGIGANGKVYFTDSRNSRVRLISKSHAPYFIVGATDSLILCQNSAAIPVNAMLAVVDSDLEQADVWTLIAPPLHGSLTVTDSIATTAGLLTPTGSAYMPVPGFSGHDTFKVRVNDGLLSDTIAVYVTVHPLPVIGPVLGSSIACITRHDTLSDIGVGGVWTASNADVSVSATGVINPLLPGTDTITYTITLLGCSDSVKKVITIYPIADTIEGPSAICVGLPDVLTGIPAGGLWAISNGSALLSSGNILGVSGGLDTVSYKVINACGTALFRKVIRINEPVVPIVFIEAFPAVAGPGRPDTLHAVIVGGTGAVYTYKWYLNYLAIPGATDSTYVSSSFHTGDSVSCIVSNGPCAISTFGWGYPIVNSVGVEELNNDVNFSLSPNPNKGTFTIEGTLPEDKNVTIEITDVIGQLVYKDVIPVSSGILNREVNLEQNIPNGLYLLHVIANGGHKVEKFMLSR